MSENKRYYWLKLNESFFEDDTITWIEEQKNGKDYVIFYLKLCLKSLNDNGKLIRYVGERLIPYDVTALSKLTNTAPDTVAVAMKLFVEIGLIEELETGEIYLRQINEMIGSETEVAKRVRKHRARQQSLGNNNQELLQCNTDVTQCNTDIDIEIDKELDIDKDNNNVSYKPIILTEQQSQFMNVLKTIKDYPFDLVKDYEYMQRMEGLYPELDLIEAIQKWAAYIEGDRPFSKNANHRSQMNTSFRNYVKWKQCLKGGSVAKKATVYYSEQVYGYKAEKSDTEIEAQLERIRKLEEQMNEK